MGKTGVSFETALSAEETRARILASLKVRKIKWDRFFMMLHKHGYAYRQIVGNIEDGILHIDFGTPKAGFLLAYGFKGKIISDGDKTIIEGSFRENYLENILYWIIMSVALLCISIGVINSESIMDVVFRSIVLLLLILFIIFIHNISVEAPREDEQKIVDFLESTLCATSNYDEVRGKKAGEGKGEWEKQG